MKKKTLVRTCGDALGLPGERPPGVLGARLSGAFEPKMRCVTNRNSEFFVFVIVNWPELALVAHPSCGRPTSRLLVLTIVGAPDLVVLLWS